MKILESQFHTNPVLMDAFLSTQIPGDYTLQHGRIWVAHGGVLKPWSPTSDSSITDSLMEKHVIGVERIPHLRVWASYIPNGYFYKEAQTRLLAQLLCLSSVLLHLGEDGEVDDERIVSSNYEISDDLFNSLMTSVPHV